MTIRYDGQAPAVPSGPLPVRVLRIESGTIHFLKMLSPEIGGCFTHFVGGRSRYCAGPSCYATWHKTEAIYKGYVAALLLRKATNDWFPCVLEITEHAELDMRQVYARGQVWALSRPAEKRGKKGPVVAQLTSHGDAKTTPPAFNLHLVLQHLFHRDDIDLSARNPLPPRLVMEPIPDAESNPIKK
jgi:hypothetical protein